jgi:hypothetical protein
METKNRDKWSEKQIKYIQFLGRGKKGKDGTSFTNEQFARAIGVNPDTLYTWKKLSGFTQAVFDYILTANLDYLPDIFAAQLIAAGKKGKGGDTQAFMAIMRQYELLKSDKIDHTTNGKDMPAPILGGIANVPANDGSTAVTTAQ